MAMIILQYILKKPIRALVLIYTNNDIIRISINYR